MNILALETTEKIGSLAAMRNGNLLLHKNLDCLQRSAQSLAPAMLALLKEVEWQPNDVQLVAVSIGPGSFTGLRVGVTAAKLFAYAIGAEVLGVDTLETIAAAAPEDVQLISTVMDAQRGEVTARLFARDADGRFEPVGAQTLVGIDAWAAGLPEGVAVSGPILARIASRLPSHIRTLPCQYWLPQASLVAAIANRDYAKGRRDDLWRLGPHYSRLAAAEEKRQAKGP